MELGINLPLILSAALIASASPGPATLAIAGTAMSVGRLNAFALASGITTGSIIWSISAALGLGAIMSTNSWLVEIIKYLGASYLLYLAYKSAASAMKDSKTEFVKVQKQGLHISFSKGLLLHLTNPKAILFFTSLYVIGLTPDATSLDLTIVVLAIGAQSFIVFHLYAFLFSNRAVANIYFHGRRFFEGVFAIAFAGAGMRILFSEVK